MTISIKLFYLYQRLRCTDNYFFKIKFVLFLYLLLSACASWKENDLSWYISVIRQTVRYRTPVFTLPYSWRLHMTITSTASTTDMLTLSHWHSNSVKTGTNLPNISDVKTWKRRNIIGMDLIQYNRIVSLCTNIASAYGSNVNIVCYSKLPLGESIPLPSEPVFVLSR